MISKDKVVELKYVLKNDDGEELDRSQDGDKFCYLHGHQNIVVGLETALDGEKVGASKKVVVEPKDGYGEFNPQLLMRIPRSNFPDDADLSPGVMFRADLGEQPVIFRVDGQEGEDVLVNGNHPLAGKTLHFDVEVLDVRDATSEELEHGHVHGEGGHHH